MTSSSTPTDRWRSALLWGVVGLLVFLVLHQGYLVAGGEFLGIGRIAALAVFVFVGAALGSYVTESRLEDESESGQQKAPTEVAADATEESTKTTAATQTTDEETADDEDEWVWGGESTPSEEESEDATQ